MSLRKFGVTTNKLSGIGGMVVNNININHNTEVAQARDQTGRIIDLVAYSLEDEITVNGLYTGEMVTPGTVLTVNDTSYLITNTSREESNTTFQTTNLRAVNYPQFVPPEPVPPTPPQPPIVNIPLTFKGLSSTNTICLSAVGNPDPIVLKAKINNGDWNSVTVDQYTYYTARLNQGDTIAFSGANDHFSTQGGNYYTFAMTGQIAASGNTMSLMNYSLSCTPYCFFKLFNGCTSLTDAPQLPANHLSRLCYGTMFAGCWNLTAAPELPATTLAQGCYQSMFAYCLYLTTVPSDLLPATTLADSCYQSMFMNCTSLTDAPQLPATTLAQGCYQMMFQSCHRLSSISVNFTDWSEANNATTNWVRFVETNNGLFTMPEDLTEIYGNSYIPSGWTVVNKDD